MRWLALVVVMACTAGPTNHGEPVTETSRIYYREIPISVSSNVDVLFVIDDSPAMAAFQTKLATNYRELVAAMTPMFGPDLHIGVVRTDPARAGALTGPFLTTELQFDATVKTNANGSLADAFVALASVGAAGDASPQPLAMMLNALTANPGFFRENAYLAIVILTAGDDNSPGIVDNFAAALKGQKSDPAAVVVSVADGACTNGALSAAAAPRLDSFLGMFPNRSTKVSICDDNIDGVAALNSQLLKTTLGAVCADEPVTDCVQWLEQRTTGQQRVIPQCPSASVPCWSLVSDPANCTTGTHQEFRLSPSGFRTTGEVRNYIECTIAP
jgi:hypothetical protein